MSLPEWVKPDCSFTEFKKVWHVRAIVDDRAVCRRWIPGKRSWNYDILDETYFQVYKEVLRQHYQPSTDNRVRENHQNLDGSTNPCPLPYSAPDEPHFPQPRLRAIKPE